MGRALAFILAAFATPASAQGFCGMHDPMVAALQQSHGEIVVARGLAGGVLIEVLSNPETGTFTIIRVLPNGRACFAAAGEAFHLVTSSTGQEG